MTIPPKTLEKWQALRSESDTKKMANQAKVSMVTIQNAFRTGEANDEVFEVMAKFYNKKEAKIKALIGVPATN